jgi:Tfp pilus assembly protein PilP
MIRCALVLCAWMLAATSSAETRDPFSPPASAPAVTPLERLDLDQLRLVALAHEARAARALLEDAAGIGYIVAVGTRVGRRGGVVVAIERRSLRIREPDGDDDIVLALTGAAETGR